MEQLSGIVLYVTFMLMVFGSVPWFRNRFYEAFKIMHVTLAISFFCFLFWHIDGEYITVGPKSYQFKYPLTVIAYIFLGDRCCSLW
jgi:ferric reductase like protein